MSGSLLQPVFALVAWTGLILLLIPIRRVGAARRGEVRVEDFRYGESEQVPELARLANRNYMNLLEAPLLFYVACLTLHFSAKADPALLATAWAYVALRVAHSVVHVSYNKVMHRFLLFGISNGVLTALWLQAWWALT